MAGWIKIHRKMAEWEWYTEPNTFRLFMHLLLHANHEDKKWKGVDVPAGSLVTGRHSLAEKTGLSERQVRTALKNLKSTNEVTSKTSNKFSIISIVKWKEYQTSDQQSDQQTTSKRPADDQQATTNKNDKNVKKDKNKDISTEPIVGSIPTNKTDESFNVTESFADEMQKLYPAVNVRQEVNKMIAWSMTNQAKRKTYTGMPKFINNWLSRQQDKGGQNGTSGQAGRKSAGDINDDWFEGLKNL